MHTRYLCIQNCDIFRHLIIYSIRFLLTNQAKLLKTLTYLGLSFVKSLPWLVIETHGSILSISFYRKTVCKKNLVWNGPYEDVSFFSRISCPDWWPRLWCSEVLCLRLCFDRISRINWTENLLRHFVYHLNCSMSNWKHLGSISPCFTHCFYVRRSQRH